MAMAMVCNGKSTNSIEAKMKINQWQRRKAGTEILVRLSKTIFRNSTVSVFKEASKNFAFSFLFIKTAYNFKNRVQTCTENTDLILEAFQKLFSLKPIPLKGTVSRDGFGMHGHLSVLGLNRGCGQFCTFLSKKFIICLMRQSL
jgi:hypothetical protein